LRTRVAGSADPRVTTWCDRRQQLSATSWNYYVDRGSTSRSRSAGTARGAAAARADNRARGLVPTSRRVRNPAPCRAVELSMAQARIRARCAGTVERRRVARGGAHPRCTPTSSSLAASRCSWSCATRCRRGRALPAAAAPPAAGSGCVAAGQHRACGRPVPATVGGPARRGPVRREGPGRDRGALRPGVVSADASGQYAPLRLMTAKAVFHRMTRSSASDQFST
jgi:hypothetical protein